ncbi:hypothetical protein N806_31275 [Rhodococcus sp. P27]|nr:hypothetical protein N806_31275 [Rhodococcus sp. P27]
MQPLKGCLTMTGLQAGPERIASSDPILKDEPPSSSIQIFFFAG